MLIDFDYCPWGSLRRIVNDIKLVRIIRNNKWIIYRIIAS